MKKDDTDNQPCVNTERKHIHISSKHDFLSLKLNEVWQYRELIWLFTKRNFSVSYRQTILGPLWLFVNPFLSSIFFVILFGNIAKLSTDGMPQFLFYFAGNTLWGYFSSCVSNNASTFLAHWRLFSKVYFPRLVVPISLISSAIGRLAIQMLFIFVLLLFHLWKGQVSPHWGWCLTIPLILLQLGMLGMGLGLVITSVTTRYRDLSILVTFGLQLWMYATPVVYPLSTTTGIIRRCLQWNPVTPSIELFRYALLGRGTLSWEMMLYSWVCTLVLAICGIMVFNKAERTFTDLI